MAAACALTAWRPTETSDSTKGQTLSEGNAFLSPHARRKIFILTRKKCTLYLDCGQKFPAKNNGSTLRYN